MRREMWLLSTFLGMLLRSQAAEGLKILQPEADSVVKLIGDIPLWVSVDGLQEGDCLRVEVSGYPAGFSCKSEFLLNWGLDEGAHLLSLVSFSPSAACRSKPSAVACTDEGGQGLVGEKASCKFTLSATLPLHTLPAGFTRLKNGTIDYPPEIDSYHRWWYNTLSWNDMTWREAASKKSPADMWNYQEIIRSIRPNLIVEFGTSHGGSTLFYSDVMKTVHPDGNYHILAVDITGYFIADEIWEEPKVAMKALPTDPDVLA